MKFKNPKSIADLKISWKFHPDTVDNIEKLFCKLNPDICKLRLISDNYLFHFGNKKISVYAFDRDSLFTFMDSLNFIFCLRFKEGILLSHFERIAENEFIIHEKC